MRLFERTGGHWLFWTGVIYFVIGIIDIYFLKWEKGYLIQVVWLTVISLPFSYPPLGRWLNLDVTWDQKMFDWIKGKKDEPTNVVPFPEPKLVPKVVPPEPPAKIFYRLGITDNNRVSFQMGYSEITMTRLGVQNLIDQLEIFKNQLTAEEDENDNS